MQSELCNQYQEKWESRSSIRSRPRKIIDFTQQGYFFPEDKQPLLINQEIISLGQEVKEKILLQSFYKYLNDIINLEIKLIYSACDKLLNADLPVNYSDKIKLSAYTVIIDEFYHVYVAKDMIQQLDNHFTNIEKLTYPVSDAFHSVAVIKERLDKKYHDTFEILAVCIFETTLVRELVEFFNSEGVHPSIKYYVNDHMNDEARHYAFFYELLCFTWENLSEEYKSNIGKYLAMFIKLYLNVTSDKQFYVDLIESILQDKNKAKSTVDNLYKGFDVTPEIPIVKNVLSVLQKSKVLDNPHVRMSFHEIGWSV